jgi:molybdopterin synthase catalytic subunit
MIKTDRYYIKLSPTELSFDESLAFIKDDTCGAESYFVGRVRNHNQGESIESLQFTAYEEMALKEMEKIAEEVLYEFDVLRIAIFHRTGDLKIGDIPVIIAVSSAHRMDAFEACAYAINTLKESVPIWKKEYRTDGHYWINAHP